MPKNTLQNVSATDCQSDRQTTRQTYKYTLHRAMDRGKSGSCIYVLVSPTFVPNIVFEWMAGYLTECMFECKTSHNQSKHF